MGRMNYMRSFETLLNECKNDNQQAMLLIYKTCCTPIFDACYRIVQNHQDAEEIVQDSFLKVFSAINKFNGDRNKFISYVKVIAVNKSIDWYRRHIKEPLFTEMEDTLVCVEESDDDDNCTYPIDKVLTAVNELPNGYRIVLTLHLIDEIDFKDIATSLKIKESTVRSQYIRAINKLKQMIIRE